MLECNLKLLCQVPLFANSSKTLVNLQTAQDFEEYLEAYILISSLSSEGWSEPANIYHLSHDIQCILYLDHLRIRQNPPQFTSIRLIPLNSQV